MMKVELRIEVDGQHGRAELEYDSQYLEAVGVERAVGKDAERLVQKMRSAHASD